jgi:hypothetical protein
MRLNSWRVLVGAASFCAACGGGNKSVSPEALERSRGEIAAQEEAFRAAKLKNDVSALRKLLTDDYVGINQNGTVRNRTQALELFRTFPIDSLDVKRDSLAIGQDVAIVNGSQVERTCAGEEAMLFLRVYVSRQGVWRLLSNSQFRRPAPNANAVSQAQ